MPTPGHHARTPVLTGLIAARPAASSVSFCTVYAATDTGDISISDGASTWYSTFLKAVTAELVGVPDGVAPLDGSGLLPVAMLPGHAGSHLPTGSDSIGGLHRSNAATYISGTGTAGADNTAQTVKSVTIPANTLTQIGDRLRVRTYIHATAGQNIIGAIKVNGVTVATSTINGTNLAIQEAWLHYIDATHANILETDGSPGASALNVAGFDWASAQSCLVAQNAVVAQHIVVAVIIVDVMPRGVF